MEDALKRLKLFLKTEDDSGIEQLTPDASTREYFRIDWNQGSAIACVYPESFDPKNQSFLDVTALFRKANLPVAEILAVEGELGIIVQEDFGDKILRDVLSQTDIGSSRDELISKAITLIAQIQSATNMAYEVNSVASRLKFDSEKLGWELAFFKTHYFTSLRQRPLSESDSKALDSEFYELSSELENHANVLCHRDFHAANLMVTKDGSLKIIDHQDARIGSTAYDLVSLLLDRVLNAPDQKWLLSKKRFLLDERQKIGLPKIELQSFEHEFDLMTIQRCLKAIGTFANQTANNGKTNYLQFVMPMFQIVLESIDRLERFPMLRSLVHVELQNQ